MFATLDPPAVHVCAMFDGADVFSVRNRKIYASRMMLVLLGGPRAEHFFGRRCAALGGEVSQYLLATFHFARNS